MLSDTPETIRGAFGKSDSEASQVAELCAQSHLFSFQEGSMPQLAGRPPDRVVKQRRHDFIRRLARGEDVVTAARESGYVRPGEMRALEVLRDLGYSFPTDQAA